MVKKTKSLDPLRIKVFLSDKPGLITEKISHSLIIFYCIHYFIYVLFSYVQVQFFQTFIGCFF